MLTASLQSQKDQLIILCKTATVNASAASIMTACSLHINLPEQTWWETANEQMHYQTTAKNLILLTVYATN